MQRRLSLGNRSCQSQAASTNMQPYMTGWMFPMCTVDYGAKLLLISRRKQLKKIEAARCPLPTLLLCGMCGQVTTLWHFSKHFFSVITRTNTQEASNKYSVSWDRLEAAFTKSLSGFSDVARMLSVTFVSRVVLRDKVKSWMVLASTGQSGYEHFANRGRGGI